LLSLIEAALFERAQAGAVLRSADYRKGIARMTFSDGSGSIVLQNFSLADGQLCIRVDLRRAGVSEPGAEAIYPQTAAFDWSEAAAKVARAWRTLAPVGSENTAQISA
jgi:hypothetical protein